MNTLKKSTLKNQVRIIGGQWRGRKITFPSRDTLRPTPDRIRETVFNWLSPFIQNADCLDLFAGSGAFAFEALSRGARSAVCVDADPEVITHLQQNKERLAASALHIIHAQALKQKLNLLHNAFDIIFIDPPFHQNMALPSYIWVHENHYLKKDGYIYLETESEYLHQNLPHDWILLKTKKTSTIRYSLLSTVVVSSKNDVP